MSRGAEGGADRGGVIGLLRPRLGAGAEQLRRAGGAPPRASTGSLPGGGRGARSGPFGEPRQTRNPPPAAARRARPAAAPPAPPAPQPAAALHRLGDGAGIGIGLLPELLRAARAPRSTSVDAGFGRAARRRQPERLGEPARRRHAEPRRTHKSEQLQQVERGEPGDVEPPRGGARVAHHRRLDLDPAARFGRRQRFDLAVGRQPHHLAEAGDQRRRLRHQHTPRRRPGGCDRRRTWRHDLAQRARVASAAGIIGESPATRVDAQPLPADLPRPAPAAARSGARAEHSRAGGGVGAAPRRLGGAAARSAVLAQKLWGLDFANPIGLAAGFDKDARVPDAMLRLGFGFVEVGTVTPRPQPGNPKPRLFRLTRTGRSSTAWASTAAGSTRSRPAVAARCAPASSASISARTATRGRRRRLREGRRRMLRGWRTIWSSTSRRRTRRLARSAGPRGARCAAAPLLDARDKTGYPAPLLLKIAPDLTAAERSDIAEVALDAGIDGLIVANTTVERPAGLDSRHAARSRRPQRAPAVRAVDRAARRDVSADAGASAADRGRRHRQRGRRLCEDSRRRQPGAALHRAGL